MFLVDTNILVHAALEDSPHHNRARTAVENWRRGAEPWFCTWPILYELMRLLTHSAVVSPPRTGPEARGFVDDLFSARSFSVLIHTTRHREVLRDVIEECPWASGSVMHDLHTAVLMREHGIKEIRSADSDFLKFGFLRVTNPLLAEGPLIEPV